MRKLLSILLFFSLALAVGCSSGKKAKKDSDEKAKETQTKKADESDDSEKADDEKSDEMADDESGDEETAGDMEDGGTEAAAKSPVKGGPEGVEVGGYCPVAYKMAGKPIQGKKEFSVDQDGKTYYLANEKAMKAFKKTPEKFNVKYDGWCATALTKGKKVQSDPTIFLVHEGATYLFSSEQAKKAFEENTAKMIKAADKNFQSM